MNYFELFELPVSLHIDKAALSAKYFALQKKYHPDFFSNASQDEQAEVLEKSSMINKALKVLQNEDALIKYVLELKGILQDEEKYQLPAGFLMEMMELNENLEETKPEAVSIKVAAYEAELYAEVKPIIEAYDEATTSVADLEQLKAYYFKKKYLERILERLEG
jgi:molecular chaperone HscB